MLRVLLLIAVFLAGPTPGTGVPSETPAPFVRIESGEARLLQEAEEETAAPIRSLDRFAGEVQIPGPSAYLEAGARTSLALSWRGFASATVTGPANLELGRGPRLALRSFRVAEVEVRRGPLALEVAGLFEAELSRAALELRALPSGAVEVLNRGGLALELRRPGAQRPTTIPPGQRLRLLAGR